MTVTSGPTPTHQAGANVADPLPVHIDHKLPAVIPAVGWPEYRWRELILRYPPGWIVEEMLHLTPPQMERGEPPTSIGLQLYSATDSPENSLIIVGGRQVTCRSLAEEGAATRCVTASSQPIYTQSAAPAVLDVFNTLVRSLRYDHTSEEFQVVFPRGGDTQDAGERHTIRWDTDVPATLTVSLMVIDMASSSEAAVILDEDVQNTGVYGWSIPATLASVGPYEAHVGYCEPLDPPPAGALSACTGHGGTSDPFYIDVDSTR